MSSIIAPVQPAATLLKPLVSSSRYMVRARQQEMLPLQQTTFSPTTNTVIEFQVSSADSFIDWASSYIRIQLQGVQILNNTSALDTSTTLSEGGAHSLFRRVSLRSATGAMICEQLNYNILAPMLSSALQSREQVRSVGASYGDSPSPWFEMDDQYIRAAWPSTSVAVAVQTTVAISGSTVTLQAAAPLEVGDIILLGKAAYTETQLVQVASVTSPTVFIAAIAPGAVLGTTNVVWDGNIIKTPKLYQSARYIAAQDFGATGPGLTRASTDSATFSNKSIQPNLGGVTTSIMNPVASSAQGITLCFQPWMEYFRRLEWDPVFLVQGGFILSLELETQPARCLISNQAVVTTFAGATFTIANPRLVAKMIQPTDKLKDQYVNLFKGPGLFYSFRSYAHYVTNDSISTNVTQQVSVGKRGVNHVLACIQAYPEMTVGAGTLTDATGSTYTVDSLATRLSAGLQRYYFTALSLNYPLDNFIRLEYDYYNAEPLAQLDYALSQYGSVLANHRFLPHEWMSINTVSGTAQESKRLILAANFAKDESPFTGVDLSQSPLQINMQFGSTYTCGGVASSLRYILLFVNHDNLAYYSSAHGIQIQN